MKKNTLIIYWSRRDFRLADNPALTNAISTLTNTDDAEKYFLPIFILENYMLNAEPEFQFGWPSRFFLSKAIPLFAANFENFLLVRGRVLETFKNIQATFPNSEIEIFVNEDVYIDFYKQVEKLRKSGFKIKVFDDQLTIGKETKSGTGNYYSIFTPFKKAVWNDFLSSKVLDKANLKNINYLPKTSSDKIKNQIENTEESIWSEFSQKRIFEVRDYKSHKNHIFDIDKLLTLKPDFKNWYFNEKDAQHKMKLFVHDLIQDYKEKRDFVSEDATSKLSLALTWGLISSRQIKQEIQNSQDEDFLNINWFDKNISTARSGVLSYLSELIWREFYKYLFFHNPDSHAYRIPRKVQK